MTASRDRLLEIASAVAEGLPVDWASVREAEPGLESSLANLHRIQGLAESFSAKMRTGDGDGPAGSRVAVWGHLRLVEELGEGSFGVVWRAFDPVLQREVALKLRREPRLGAATGESGGREFIDEARRLARVRHPNILGVHGADVHDGQVGLWTDLLESDTLEAQLGSGAAVSFDRQLAIARDLTLALQAVHEAGLVHGDVKASNVAIEEDGRAVLLDFGAGVDLSLVSEGSRSSYGSPLSSSPQRLHGGQLSAADDLWSLGVLLFRLACGGRYPFPACHLEELRSMLDTVQDPSWQQSSVPAAYRQLVTSLLDRSASSRPTAGRVLERLERIAAAPSRRRRRRALAVVLGSLSLGLLLATAGAWRARVAAREEASARLDAEETTRFLKDLLQAPSLTSAGEQVKVIEVLASAEERLEATWSRGSALRAQIWVILGGTYMSLRRFEEAAPLFERAAEELAQHYEAGHPLRLATQLGLAEVAYKVDELDRAEALLAQVEEEAVTLDPNDDVRVHLATVLGGLAEVQGRTQDADRHYAHAWNLRSDPAWRGDGARHRAAETYGTALHGWGRFEEAVALLTPLVPELRETRGWRDGRSLSILNSLAVSLAHLNRREEAVELLTTLDVTANEWLGEGHSFSINMRNNRYAALRELGRPEEAIGPFEELLQTARRRYPRDSETTLSIETNLALAERDAGRAVQATTRLGDIYRRSSAAPRGMLNRLVHAVNYAEALLEQQGDAGAAIEVLVPRRSEFVPLLGEGSYFLLAVDSVLRAAQVEAGRVEALVQLEEVLEAQRRIAGRDDEQVLLTQLRLAGVLASRGRLDEALTLVDDVIHLTAQWGVEHPLVRSARATRQRLGSAGDPG